ncbi:hypothetical protein Golomagni_07383, partial [Golovinomyces magnicellulatus]
GGFLIDDDDPATSAKTAEELRKAKERERQRLRDYAEPGISLDIQSRPVCESCGSPEIIDHPFKKVFGILVCRKCERDKPEAYSLLTKTEVKQDYLLTDAELKDEELMPHLLKANPHKATLPLAPVNGDPKLGWIKSSNAGRRKRPKSAERSSSRDWRISGNAPGTMCGRSAKIRNTCMSGRRSKCVERPPSDALSADTPSKSKCS